MTLTKKKTKKNSRLGSEIDASLKPSPKKPRGTGQKKATSLIPDLKTEVGLNTGVRQPVEKYYETVGRRKTAVARVRLYTKKAGDESGPEERALITVNNKDYSNYFTESEELKSIVEAPLKKLKSVNRFKALVKVSGGGITGQAEAVRLGLSRALVLFDANFSKKLKKSGYLTRNPKEKERRKYGLKKARKAPQWAKR